ncbi:MAG: bifunctional diguanylate cyclase/phosphodiesterase [Pseudomonadota bacterium]
MAAPTTLRYQTPAAALFVLLIGSAWLTAWGWKQQAIDDVIERELQRSIAVATSLGNAVWSRHAEALQRAAHLTPQALRKADFLDAIGAEIDTQVRGQRVLEVSIQDARGLVLYSTNSALMGERTEPSPAISEALDGRAWAELVSRSQFTTMDGRRLASSDLIRAFVPAAPGRDAPQTAFFEVYTDVSAAIEDIRQDEHRLWAIANLAGLVLFSLALQILRRAERTQREKDAATGLWMREVAQERLVAGSGIASSAPGQTWGCLAVALLRMRQVSAAFGHATGDDVLRRAAERLGQVGGDTAELFRLPGDAFIFLLGPGEPGRLEQDSSALAQAVQACFDTSLACNDHSIIMEVALGEAFASFADAGMLLMRAEAALAHAREAGPGSIVRYVDGLERTMAEDLQLKAELAGALERGEFEVFYQPLVSAGEHRLLGAEALLRWRHPARGLVSPGRFIPILEESGLIVKVGEFILREACRQARAWRQTLAPDFVMSVNLSTRQFTDPQLPARIGAALDDAGLPAAALILEVTETFLAMNPEKAAALLRQLKETLGVTVAIDDFGQGYSSLAALRQLPVDILKIDRAFVINAPSDPADASVARAVAALAQGLSLTLVAEGVETEAQAEFTRGIGCHKLQGYLFNKPLDAAAFAAAYS